MAATLKHTPAIPQGSLVLVTGASGFIASHIVAEFLKLGYNVRGTVRSADKAASTAQMFRPFESAAARYAPVLVADFAAADAFVDAVRGCAAVVHTASDTTFGPDPNAVIPPTVAGATGAIRAAIAEPGVARFVYTSSSTAATIPKPGVRFPLNADTWDDEVVELAWRPPPYEADRAFPVYAASKTEAERAVWAEAKGARADLVVNSVLPNGNIGTILKGGSAGVTGLWVPALYRGDLDSAKNFPPQWFVDVQDDARIHVAAAIDPSVKNERIYAFAEPFNWNDVIDSIKKARPAYKQGHLEGQLRDLSEPENKLGAEMLTKWWGQDGYKSLDQSVAENLEGL